MEVPTLKYGRLAIPPLTGVWYKYINVIWFSCHWLAMSNSCYNPFIYAIYNIVKFRSCNMEIYHNPGAVHPVQCNVDLSFMAENRSVINGQR
ncbi:hypothetical protein TNIN_197731 [Trichonephila inaurata madagascariensis]|uniref:G-protein coupled receptors family 1 profile domain-containing protein n=1 Tax=Trichonephila inaurata madagascariensis TaxID=2747483 RepID=A0A8X7BYP5_9ARAC|nr:hypothetical protein TNIN_197731 [Trichonephila inaurata madagascariensis]